MTTPQGLSSSQVLSTLAFLAGAVAVGALAWRRCGLRRMQPLPAPEQDGDRGSSLLGLFAVTWLGIQLLLSLFVATRGDEPLSLPQQLAFSSAANGLGLGLALGLLSRRPGALATLGFSARPVGFSLVAGVSAWLVFLPVLALAKACNQAMLKALGHAPAVQDHLQSFLSEGGAQSLWAWAGMGVILPICEEILFRGALYGGLRRLLSPTAAAVISGLLFGVIHDPVVMLPVAALGVLLAWVYERSGSLMAPCVLHVTQNLSTLALASLSPDLIS